MRNRWAVTAILIALAARTLPSQPAFEAAEVKRNLSGEKSTHGGEKISPAGRFEVRNTPLLPVLWGAFDVQEHALVGAPAWAESERFDIVAKAPAGTSMDQLRLMLQSLLIARFHLVSHREDRVMTALALVPMKSSSRIRPAAGIGESHCASLFGDGVLNRTCEHTTMPELVRQLAIMGRAMVSSPIVDATGLTGSYDFQLTWNIPDGHILDGLAGIGLRLDSRKIAVPVVAIDRLDRLREPDER